MRSVRITVDGITYILQEQFDGSWLVTNKAPYTSGEYPVEVLITTENGQVVTIDVDDPELAEALTLIVTEGTTVSGERMLNYYPQVVQQILEFQAIIKSEGFEVDFLKNEVQLLVNEAYLTTMGEERVASWEKALGMHYDPEDDWRDRRDAVIARIRGQGKLNTTLINAIVNAFTGGTAISYVKDSCLYVKILPPPQNKQYKFENVKRELAKKVPAHLGLDVMRYYSTWGEVKSNFAKWDAVNDFINADGDGATWEDIKLWIAPQ